MWRSDKESPSTALIAAATCQSQPECVPRFMVLFVSNMEDSLRNEHTVLKKSLN